MDEAMDRANKRERARAILSVCIRLENCIHELDAMQVGDVRGRISPLKHELRNALAPIVERMRDVARQEYQGE